MGPEVRGAFETHARGRIGGSASRQRARRSSTSSCSCRAQSTPRSPILLIEPWHTRSELEGPLQKTVEPALARVARRRRSIRVAQSPSSARDGAGTVLLLAIGLCRAWYSAARAVERRLCKRGTVAIATLSSLGRQPVIATRRWALAAVKARYFFGHPRISTVRSRLTLGEDIRRVLAVFGCGVAVCATAAVVLLTPWIPSTRRLGEAPASAAKVPEAPIPLPEPNSPSGRARHGRTEPGGGERAPLAIVSGATTAARAGLPWFACGEFFA